MARDITPLHIADLSAFTKSLRQSLAQSPQFPTHLQLMGHIAKAAGFRNYQSLKAMDQNTLLDPNQRAADYAATLVQPETPLPAPDKRALRVFDTNGVLVRWPKQQAVRRLCLWVMWSRIPARQALSEAQVNEVLKASNGFDDHVVLRRTLVDYQYLDRTNDGRVYRRVEQRPPEDALALIQAVPALGSAAK